MYELYEQMLAAYKTGNMDVFIPAARKWFQRCKKNPFISDTDAHDAFFQAQRHFGYWTSGGINSRVSKQRFIAELQRICEIGVPNPHAKDEPAEEPKEEPIHVLGVIPENGPTSKPVRTGGWKLSSDTIVSKGIAVQELKAEIKAEIKEELKEEAKEEPKEEAPAEEQPKKRRFGRSKKR